jgi:hypothetical protein
MRQHLEKNTKSQFYIKNADAPNMAMHEHFLF